MSRVSKKVALVTGGAMGIGRACAELLAAEGAAVVVTDREVDEGRKVVECINTRGGSALFISHDVSIEDRWQHAINVCVATYGRLDILVNNAGVGWFGDVEHTTLDDWHKLLSINLDGVFLGIKHAIPAMRIGGSGSIINLSSIEGLVGDPALAAYNASKGAVRLLSKSAALYCAKGRMNIRVNSVHPGYIWTPMVHHGVESSGALGPDAALARGDAPCRPPRSPEGHRVWRPVSRVRRIGVRHRLGIGDRRRLYRSVNGGTNHDDATVHAARSHASARRAPRGASRAEHARAMAASRARWNGRHGEHGCRASGRARARSPHGLQDRRGGSLRAADSGAARRQAPRPRCVRGSERSDAAHLVATVRSRYRELIPDRGDRAEWDFHLDVGDPGVTLVRLAKELHPDLVIVGLAQREALDLAVGGRTAVCAARYLEVPLFAAAVDDEAPSRVIVALPDGKLHAPTLRAALACVSRPAKVWLAFPERHPALAPDITDSLAIAAAVRELCGSEIADLLDDVRLERIDVGGDMLNATLRLSDELYAQLIAIPNHGDPGPVRTFLPNLADPLLFGARCSVLVVPDGVDSLTPR